MLLIDERYSIRNLSDKNLLVIGSDTCGTVGHRNKKISVTSIRGMKNALQCMVET